MYEAKREHFNLESIRLKSTGGVVLKHNLQIASKVEDSPDIVFDNIYGVEELTFDADDELRALFESLKPMVCRIFKLDSFRVIVGSEKFKATTEQSRFAERHFHEIMKKVEVRGVHLYKWDSDETRNIKISAVFTEESGQKVSLVTGKLMLSQTLYGNEAEIESICENIIDEAYKYRYEGKSGQLSLFDANAPKTKKETKKSKKEEAIEA